MTGGTKATVGSKDDVEAGEENHIFRDVETIPN